MHLHILVSNEHYYNMPSKLWNNYNSKQAYDGYFTKDNKLRKHATIISSILEKYGKKKTSRN